MAWQLARARARNQLLKQEFPVRVENWLPFTVSNSPKPCSSSPLSSPLPQHFGTQKVQTVGTLKASHLLSLTSHNTRIRRDTRLPAPQLVLSIPPTSPTSAHNLSDHAWSKLTKTRSRPTIDLRHSRAQWASLRRFYERAMVPTSRRRATMSPSSTQAISMMSPRKTMTTEEISKRFPYSIHKSATAH